jgi:hypothetical protein
MNNVYSFDDKILHIESLQLKRTNEILDSRDEAVDALLNYCGDETMDGMPLLARYWADDGHTEIKHVRGYIHNVNGTMGISIDDICDVDRDEIIEIIEEMLSGVTANTINLGHFNKYYEAESAIKSYEGIGVEGINLIATYDTIDPDDTNINVLIGSTLDAGNGEVKGNLVNPSNVQYWECNEEDGEGTHKKQPFRTRNGAYKSAQRELILPGVGSDVDWELGYGSERMEKHEDPTIYITPVTDERRHGSWIGTTPKITQFNQYSVLTIDSQYDYNKLGPRWGGYYEDIYKWSKPTIIDPRRYEHKIHKALNSCGYVDKNKYVIKKRIPLHGKYFNKYYFQGTGVQFELAPINPGGVLEIEFDSHFYPFGYFSRGSNAVTSDWKMRAFMSGRRYKLNSVGLFIDGIDNGDVEIYFLTGTTSNIMQIKNNTSERTGYYSVTMEYYAFGDDVSESGYYPQSNIIVCNKDNKNSTRQYSHYQSTGNPNRPYSQAGSELNDGFGGYSKKIMGGSQFVYIEYKNLDVAYGKKITAETTSPGFRIENGKIKCYRGSNLKEALDMYMYGTWKYIKNGSSFYYNDRNVYNCGVGPQRQTNHHNGLNSLFLGANTFEKSGRMEYKVEFLSHMQRGYSMNKSDWQTQDHICTFGVKYLGFDSDTNLPVFSVTKTESDTDIYIGRIGVAFVGVDGNMHSGYFESYKISGETEERTAFASGQGSYNITVGNFKIKQEHYGNNYYTPYPNYSTMRNIVVKYVTFNFDKELEFRPVRFVGTTQSHDMDCGGVSYDSRRYSYTKWVNVSLFGSTDGAIRKNFTKHYFNKCRFIRIYKRIPSEFPEYFYTR